jgi:hypothetical protein
VELGKDGEPSYIRVRYQLTRATRDEPARRAPLKSDAARRDIEIPTQLANLLRAHRKEMLHKGLYRADGFVFSIETGGPIYYRNLSSRGPRQGGQPRLGSNPRKRASSEVFGASGMACL